MRRPVLFLVLAFLVVLFVAPPPVFADKIETATHYVFKVKGMGEQKFKKSEVLKIEKGESSFDVYEKRKKGLGTDDVKGWYDLGMWCKEQSLMKEARQCFRAAVKADPDHAPARRALGYVRYQGDWLTEKKYKKVAAETEAKESEIIADVKPSKEPVQDATLRYMIIGPAGWTAKKEDGEGVTFDGPELGSGPVTVRLTVDAEGGDLDELVKEMLKELTEEHDGLIQKGDPTGVTLAGKPAKMLVTAWTAEDLQPWAVDMERRDFLMVAETGVYHLSIECVAGYYEKLRGTFDKVIASVKILGKPLDVMATEKGFGFSFPDDTYEKGTFLPLKQIVFKSQGGDKYLDITKEVVSVRHKGGPTLFVVHTLKKTDTTTLEALRGELPGLWPIAQIFQFGTDAAAISVDGVEGQAGSFRLGAGNNTFANGRWCVLIKGDRAYQIMFFSFMGGMGQRYLKQDFAKFMEGFKFL